MAKRKPEDTEDSGVTEETNVKPLTDAERTKLMKDVMAKAKTFDECDRATKSAKKALDDLVEQMALAGLTRFKVGSKIFGIGGRGEKKFLRVTDLSDMPTLG